MALINCPECGEEISEHATVCPQCGAPLKPEPALKVEVRPHYRGFEWKSKARLFGWPLVHVAIGRDKETGKLLAAKGIIAIGQFGIGLVTIAQFGIGLLFGFGQFVGGTIAIGQFALGTYFGLGQFATGLTVIGQFALGKYVLAQMGYGTHVWSTKLKDPEAIEHFRNLWQALSHFIGRG